MSTKYKENDLNAKWSCKRCTFDNWPKSAFCTLCSAARNSNLIINREPHCEEERDIYKIAPLIVDNSNSSLDSKNKWACQMCTYLNWPKSIKCTQCLSIRKKCSTSSRSSSPIPLSNLHSKNNSINASKSNLAITSSTSIAPYNVISSSTATTAIITKTNATSNNILSATTTTTTTTAAASTLSTTTTIASSHKDMLDSKPNSPNSVPICSDANENYTSPKISSTMVLTSDGYVQKWSCQACTYENWPKSFKCVICLTPKGKSEISSNLNNNDLDTEHERISNTPSPPGAQGGKKLSANDMTLLYNYKNKESSENSNIIINNEATTCNINTNTNNNVNSANNNQIISKSYHEHLLENKRIRQMRKKYREIDWLWLDACNGVVNGDIEPVLRYLAHEGDLSRHLTASEVTQLARPSAFDVGHTLAHLALRFQRHELLSLLLANTSTPIAKRVPSDVSREISTEIKRHFTNCLRQRKGEFPCFFVSEFVTFSLPTEIEYLVPSVQRRLFDELLDRDVQKELEEDSPIINWSDGLTDRLNSRLYALWNRSTGDCLLDSALQATWGIFDKDNVLRKSLADSLSEASQVLFPRFKEAETLHPNLLHYTLEEDQWEEDWAVILSLASQPGSALEQFHIFTLAHILRRPIIVYGVKYVKSFRGETLGYAGYEGIYLPLLWESSFCWKSPIALGYTRGHFSALVPIEPDSIESRVGASAPNIRNDDSEVTYLPLVTSENKLLSLHFLSRNELGREDEIMRQYLDCCVTEGGILVAKQKLGKRPLLVSQMLDDWINFYRNLAPSTVVTHSPVAHGYSSDGDSE